MVNTVDVIIATFNSRANSQNASESSMKQQYTSCMSLIQLAIRSTSVLINVIAVESETVEVFIRRVFWKMSDTKLPRNIVIARSNLC